MSVTKDQDVFQESTTKTPILDLFDEYNDLEAQDIDKGTFTREHVPTNITGIFSGSMMVSGPHGTDPLGWEEYGNKVYEDTVSSQPYPRYDHVTANPMRTAGTSPPYGADVNDGWSIIADQNSSSSAAEIGISALNIDSNDAFSEGRLEFNVSGYVEISRHIPSSPATAATGILGPLLAVAIKVGTKYYVIPESIGMWHCNLYRNTIHVRHTFGFDDIDDLIHDQVSPNRILNSIALVFALNRYTDIDNYLMPTYDLGVWNLTAEPVVRGDF